MRPASAVGAVALTVALCGCVQVVGTFVRDVQVVGYYLVIERCEVVRHGDSLGTGACTTERQRLPVTVYRSEPLRSPSRPVEIEPVAGDLALTVTPAQVDAGLEPLRAGAKACGTRLDVHGNVRVTLAVSSAGAVTAVELDTSNPELIACLRAVFLAGRFVATREGRRFAWTLALP